MMSHPSYSQYHRLELEYNAMVAQYQFEQWHYSQQAASQGRRVKDFSMTDALSSAALDQELQARVAIKQNELNAALGTAVSGASPGTQKGPAVSFR